MSRTLAIVLSLLCLGSSPVQAQTYLPVKEAITTLQPRVSLERSGRLAGIIDDAGREYGVDPLLITIVAMAESSFRPDIEHLLVKGRSLEVGLMQVNPRGPAMGMRPQGCPSTLKGAECQIRTGTAYLNSVRERCPGTPWRWMGSYRTKHCLSEKQTLTNPYVLRLKSLYQQIGH